LSAPSISPLVQEQRPPYGTLATVLDEENEVANLLCVADDGFVSSEGAPACHGDLKFHPSLDLDGARTRTLCCPSQNSFGSHFGTVHHGISKGEPCGCFLPNP
jgi:hypothetical protein